MTDLAQARRSASSLLIPQRDALYLVLAMIGGPAPVGQLIETRVRPRSGGMRQEFWAAERPRRMIRYVEAAAGYADVFVGVAPRARRSGGLDAIAHVAVLWADLDTTRAVAALMDVVPRLVPAPSVIIRSGSDVNLHVYWQLREPVTPEQARRANRRLAYHLGGDRDATDAARILRPPGTRNYKHTPARPVECVRLEALSYYAQEVVGGLADPPELSRDQRRAVSVTRGGDDWLLAIAPDVYVAVLTGQEIGRDRKARCPFHDDRTPSLHVYDDAAGGWCCFGCGRGGTIIDFAAHLWGIEPRGAGYHELRRRLGEVFLAAQGAA